MKRVTIAGVRQQALRPQMDGLYSPSLPKMPLTGRAMCVIRPGQGQKVTGLGGSQAKTNKQYSGQILANLGGGAAERALTQQFRSAVVND